MKPMREAGRRPSPLALPALLALLALSACAPLPTEPTGAGLPLAPSAEYRHPAGGASRTVSSQIDIGAYEAP